MAIPTTKIYLRSPYRVTKSRANLDYIIVDLYVWTGDLVTAEPSTPTLRLRSTAFDGKASIDIAEYARDYVEVTFSGTEASNAVWVMYDLTWVDTDDTTGTDSSVYLTGFDGFGYFEDEENYQWSNDLLISDSRQNAVSSTVIKTPVHNLYLTGYELYKTVNLGTPFHSVTGLTADDDTSATIQYVSNFGSGDYADYIVMQFNNGVAYERTVYIDYADCTKFDAQKIYFVNRHGAVQQLQFLGKSGISINTESETYKRNLMETDGTYDSKRHQIHTLNKNGKIAVTLNSGWVKEDHNDAFTEMLLSEQVWMYVERDVLGIGWIGKEASNFILPVIVKTDSLQIKRKKEDKLFNYTIEFEGAADRINTVR